MNLTAKVSPSFLYSLFVKTLLFSYLCSIKSQLQPHPITRHNHLFKTTPFLVITQQSIQTTSPFFFTLTIPAHVTLLKYST